MRATAMVILTAMSLGGCRAGDLHATDFGVVADGVTNDGPAILKLIEAARKTNAPRLIFPKNKVIHVTTGMDRYVLPLQQSADVTVDGNGCTFMLAPHLRMADLTQATKPMLKNFNVDYTVTMFIDSVILAVDANGKYVDVRVLADEQVARLGGPTKEDGEQWFGGFVWCENGDNPKAATHYAVARVEQLGEDRARVFFAGESIPAKISRRIKPGSTRFSLPRPGVAHRYGPGPLFKIHDVVDPHLENIAVWGVPWFALSIYRCEGTGRFINVDVKPRPGSGRLMAGCRDAFHVTANRATLLFDGCDTAGIGDDDYNLCILSSVIDKVISPTEVIIRQKFPIQYCPMRVGETLMVINDQNTIVGSARITRYDEIPAKNGRPISPGGRFCPSVRVTLAQPIDGLAKGLTTWSKEAANPHTTLRRCTTAFSNRFQTSVTIEDCTLTCFNWAYGMRGKHGNIEGPGPAFVKIVNSTIRPGRGSGFHIACDGVGPLDTARVRSVQIENSTFHAPLLIRKARSVTLISNRFFDRVEIGQHQELRMSGNTQNGRPFAATR
jgi:hypothetical protein